MTTIDGRVAVVTGGASGIGRALAAALLAEGATVVVADRDEAALAATVEELRAIGPIDGIVVDVADPESVRALAAEVVARHGAPGIVCLNAGVGSIAWISDLTLDAWHRIIDVNLWGTIHGIDAFLPLLRANPDGGHVVLTGSSSSFVPSAGFGAYSVSKFGIRALAEVLAEELDGTGVGVTLLAPGTVRTQFGRRPGDTAPPADLPKGPRQAMPALEPEDVAAFAIRAIVDEQLYAPTHPEWAPHVADRHAAIQTSFDRILEDS